MESIELNYADFISAVTGRSICIHWYAKSRSRYLLAFDGPLKFETKVDDADADWADFVANHQVKSNKQMDKRATAQNVPQVAMRRPEGSSATMVSYDMTDKCTWYQNPTVVTAETLSDSGDGLTFNSLNPRWIDLTHGRMYGEDNIVDKKEATIYVAGVAVTTGFTLDYDNGDITFGVAPVGAVTADYFYGSDSTFTMGPIAGKTLIIEHAELQFSKNMVLSSPVNFEIWAYNPYDLPNKVLYQRITYKNMKDVINAANLGQGYIPACSGLTNDVLVMPFNYATVKPLSSASGVELRITVDNDVEFAGEWGTATFYILSENE